MWRSPRSRNGRHLLPLIRALITPAALRAAAGLSVAAAFVVAVSWERADGAFTAATSDTGNQVGSAADFCTSPGSVSLAAAADNSVSQSGADALADATNARLRVISKYTAPSQLNHRTFVRFDLPPRPAGCALSSATLKLSLDISFPGRTLDAHPVNPSLPLWSEGGFRYSTQPGTAGTAVGALVPAAPAVLQWEVTTAVTAQYSGNHNGWLVRDRLEGDTSGLNVEQVFFSRDTANSGPTLGKQPALTLVWS